MVSQIWEESQTAQRIGDPLPCVQGRGKHRNEIRRNSHYKSCGKVLLCTVVWEECRKMITIKCHDDGDKDSENDAVADDDDDDDNDHDDVHVDDDHDDDDDHHHHHHDKLGGRFGYF